MLAIGLAHYLTVGAILFVLGILGIFLNRKNIIVILMSVELILLSVNLNLVAFSAQLGDLTGHALRQFTAGNYGWTQDVRVAYFNKRAKSPYNSAAGKYTWRSNCLRVAPSIRVAFSTVGLTSRTPCRTLKNTMKNTSVKPSATLLAMPNPNHMAKMGARITRGMALAALM